MVLFLFNLPVQLEERNDSNRFSIMERRLTGFGGRGLFRIRNEGRFVKGYAVIDANLRLNKPWHRGKVGKFAKHREILPSVLGITLGFGAEPRGNVEFHKFNLLPTDSRTIH